jgi:hypothetical protein
LRKRKLGNWKLVMRGLGPMGKCMSPSLLSRLGRVLESVLIYRIRLKLFTDAGFTLIPGKGNSGSKVLIRKSFLYFHRRMVTDYQGTKRNQIYILYHLIIRGRRRIMLISFGGLLASRKGLEFCCFARVCIILYLVYRVSTPSSKSSPLPASQECTFRTLSGQSCNGSRDLIKKAH